MPVVLLKELVLIAAILSNICFHAFALFCAVPGVAVGTPINDFLWFK